MKLILIKDYCVSDAWAFAWAFLSNNKPYSDNFYKKVEKLVNEYGSDENLINDYLRKKYNKNKYFVLCDYIDDNNNGYFRIRIWKFFK